MPRLAGLGNGEGWTKRNAWHLRWGAKWRPAIEKALASAKVAVLLVSDLFLASPFIQKTELPPLLRAAEAADVTLLWVYVRTCLWKKTSIFDYQAAHDISRPLAARSPAEQDEELAQVAEAIEAALG